MSTILKALKKVEGKREASVTRPGMPGTVAIPKTMAYPGWLKGLVAVAFLLVVAMGVVVGFLFLQSSKGVQVAQKPVDAVISPKEEVSPPSIQNELAMKDPLPVNPVVDVVLPPEKKVTSPSVNNEPAPKTPLLKNSETDVVLPSEKKVSQALVKNAPEIPNPLPTDPKIEPPKPTDDQLPKTAAVKKSVHRPVTKGPSKKLIEKSPKTVTPISQVESEAPVEPKPLASAAPSTDKTGKKSDVPLLEDRTLKIQALVYSEDSTKRMIVLNGEILRQGYEYKGYTIEQIESQRVLVKKNGKVSALLFGK